MIYVYTLCETAPMRDMGDRLRRARERKFPSARRAALKHGWPTSSYAAHENGQNDYAEADAKKYGKAFKTRWAWLLTGVGSPGWDDHIESSDILVDDEPDVPPQSGIREIDVRAGMGGGGTTEGREVSLHGNASDPLKDESWRFPSKFVREELRAPESRVLVIETQGDSMSPTLLSGDRVIVDTGHTLPSPDGIYAVRDRFGNIIVKRLQIMRRSGKIRIISDNKTHDPEDVGAEEIEVVGRVLWGLKRL